MRGASLFRILSEKNVVSRHTMLRIRSYIAEICSNKFKLSAIRSLNSDYGGFMDRIYNVTVVAKENRQIVGIKFSVSIRLMRRKFNFATCTIKVEEMPAYDVE